MPLATLQCVGLNDIITCDAITVADLKEYAVSLGWGHDGAIAKILNEQRIGQRLSARVDHEATYVFVPAVNQGAQQGPAVWQATAAESASRCVARLMEGGSKCIGTVCLVGSIVVTARHCVVDSGKLIPNLTAFSQPLNFILASPMYDLAFFSVDSELPAGLLLAQPPSVGKDILLAGYPLALDADRGPTDVAPSVTRGRVVLMAVSGIAVFADYSGAMPNASGGAVFSGANSLQGIHLGSTYHNDGEEARGPRKTASPPGAPETEVDPAAMWVDDQESKRSQGSGKRRKMERDSEASSSELVRLNGEVERLDLTVANVKANVRHKGLLAYFVPSFIISMLWPRVKVQQEKLNKQKQQALQEQREEEQQEQ